MEPYYAGWLSLVPPVLAITLALVSKEVISSLLFGILSGTLIYSLGVGLHPVAGTIGTAFELMTEHADLNIIFFVCMLGGLVAVIAQAGGSAAYGQWASARIKNGKLSLLAAAALGVIIFIDDYFNCLTVGTVMKPLTDKYRISRAKLAYIIDCTAAPVCIIAPVSSWAAAVGSNLEATGYYDNGFQVFLSTIPFNLYALLSLAMVFLVILFNINFGPMQKSEQAAARRKPDTPATAETLAATGKGTPADMLLPILFLIVVAITAMLYTGGFFSPGAAYLQPGAAFSAAETSKSLVWAGFGAIVFCLILFVPRKLMSFHEFMDSIVEGFKTMLPACCILFLAWTVGAVCRDLLNTPGFVSDSLASSSIPVALLPAIVFIIAAFLSFSTGTAWGTFSILIPIIAPVAHALAPELLTVSLSATLAGSVFGDNCSPISDTTILSSAGAECDHIEHVSTQLPYALCVAACCLIGYLTAGLSRSNLPLTLAVSFISLLTAAAILRHRSLHNSCQLSVQVGGENR